MNTISCILEYDQNRYTLSVWHNALEEVSIAEQCLQLVLRCHNPSTNQLERDISWTGTFTGSCTSRFCFDMT